MLILIQYTIADVQEVEDMHLNIHIVLSNSFVVRNETVFIKRTQFPKGLQRLFFNVQHFRKNVFLNVFLRRKLFSEAASGTEIS